MSHARSRARPFAPWYAAFAALLLLSAAPVGAQDAELTQVASVEGITEYRLPNGLQVLLFPDASSPTTTVNVTYFVGSRHEGYGETGMAHLLEHLVFKGTPSHPNIPQELTEHGASPNGTTSFDRTNYFETFQSSPENLEWALDLEADRMINSFISADDLASEMTVVRNEFESGENSPFLVMLKRLVATMYAWHNYANLPIGARSDIENVPIERLQAFYRRYYQPDNAMLVVAGRFDEARAKELIEEKFGAISRPARSGDMALWPTYTREPVQDGERSVTLRRVGDVQMLAIGHHVAPGPHEDWAALSVLNHALTDAPTGRLYKSLVESGRAASVQGVPLQAREASPYIFIAEVRTEDSLEEARDAAIAVIDSLSVSPITEEEVERAKSSLLRQIQLAFNNSQSIALQLSEWASMGDWRLMFIHRDRIEQVTPARVAQVVERYFLPSNRTVAMFIPEDAPRRAQIPDVPNVDSLAASYAGRAEVAAGEEFDPSPDNIDARTETFTLPNGTEVAFLQKDTRGDAVHASITLRFGTEDALTGLAEIGDLAGAMLMRGTENRTRAEIEDEFNRLKANAQIFGSVNRGFAQLTTTRENLVAALRLAAEVLKQPAFDAAEFAQLKESQLASIEQARSEPNALAFNELSRRTSGREPGHPLYVPTFDEQIARINAITIEDVRAFYDRFYGPSSATIVVVGDFDRQAVREVIASEFGTWEPRTDYAHIADPFREIAADDIEIETPDKANAIFLAYQPIRMRDTSPDYPAMVLANFMLGGGFLNSRLATRIRQQEGLSYGVGSGFDADEIDEKGAFQVFAIYAPENKEKLEAAFRDEMTKAIEEGFTPEEVAAAKAGWLQQQVLGRANDQVLRTFINNNLYYDRTMQFREQLEESIGQLTAEQVNEVLRKYIDLNSMLFVKAGDFAKPST